MPMTVKEKQNWGEIGADGESTLLKSRKIEGPLRPVSERDQAEEIALKAQAVVSRVLDQAEQIVQGERTRSKLFVLLSGMLFGRNVYLIGTSGVGKTFSAKVLSRLLGFPSSRIDGNPQLSPSDIIGFEFPLKNGGFHRTLGILTDPSLVKIIDEVNRINATTRSTLLRPIEERSVSAPDFESGAGYRSIQLFPGTCFIMTANPGSYGGVGQSNEAVLDRIHMGLDMGHPMSSERVRMLRSPVNRQAAELEAVPLNGLTLFQLRSSLRYVTISPQLMRTIVQLSYLVSPKSFRDHSGWVDDESFEDPFRSNRQTRKEFEDLKNLVEEACLEGGNPRGERAVLDNAAIFALLNGRLEIDESDVRLAFQTAYRMRLKAYPGYDEQVPTILRRAVNLVIPGEAL